MALMANTGGETMSTISLQDLTTYYRSKRCHWFAANVPGVVLCCLIIQGQFFFMEMR